MTSPFVGVPSLSNYVMFCDCFAVIRSNLNRIPFLILVIEIIVLPAR